MSCVRVYMCGGRRGGCYCHGAGNKLASHVTEYLYSYPTASIRSATLWLHQPHHNNIKQNKSNGKGRSVKRRARARLCLCASVYACACAYVCACACVRVYICVCLRARGYVCVCEPVFRRLTITFTFPGETTGPPQRDRELGSVLVKTLQMTCVICFDWSKTEATVPTLARFALNVNLSAARYYCCTFAPH